jgi:hypothetical protein
MTFECPPSSSLDIYQFSVPFLRRLRPCLAVGTHLVSTFRPLMLRQSSDRQAAGQIPAPLHPASGADALS